MRHVAAHIGQLVVQIAQLEYNLRRLDNIA